MRPIDLDYLERLCEMTPVDGVRYKLEECEVAMRSLIKEIRNMKTTLQHIAWEDIAWREFINKSMEHEGK